MDPAPRTIGTLTSLRWLAAFLVLLHHGLGPLYRAHPENSVLATLDQGRTGVTFFFVLSGFVLAWVYQHTFRTLEVRAVASFWLARLARIWPLHAVTFIAAIAVMWLTSDQTYDKPLAFLSDGVLNLFLLQGIFYGGHAPLTFNYVSWTLACEIVFYLMLPIALFAAIRFHRGAARGLVAWSSAWVAGVGFVAISTSANPAMADAMNISPFFRSCDFLLGVALALWFIERERAAQRRVMRRGAWTGMEIGVVGLVVATMWIGGTMVPYTLTQTVWATPTAAVLVWVFAHERGLLSKVLRTRVLLYLGELSFGVYMWHQLVLRVEWMAWADQPLLALGMAIPVSLLLAAVTYHTLEVPSRRAIRRRGTAFLDARFGPARPEPLSGDTDGSRRELDELDRPAA